MGHSASVKGTFVSFSMDSNREVSTLIIHDESLNVGKRA